MTQNQFVLENSYYGTALKKHKKPKVKTSVRINGEVIRLDNDEAERVYRQRRIRDYMEWVNIYFEENDIAPEKRYYDSNLSDKDKLKIRRHYQREVAKVVCDLIDSHRFSDILEACEEGYDILMNGDKAETKVS